MTKKEILENIIDICFKMEPQNIDVIDNNIYIKDNENNNYLINVINISEIINKQNTSIFKKIKNFFK